MKLFLSLALGYAAFLTSQSLVLAVPAPVSSTHSKKTLAQTVRFSPPQPPPSPPPGGRTRGGARRTPLCLEVKPQLTALVPSTESPPTVTNVWGWTTKTNPTLWFYMPYTKDSAYPTEFVLQDQQSNPIYQQAIALPSQPGVISISLPTNAPKMDVNKQYRWFLTVYCDQQKQSPPIYVEGVIQRVNINPKVTQQLQTATPLQQSAIYAQNGIWHDALTTLAQLRQKDPQDKALKTAWRDLLTSIGLDDIVAKPILPEKSE
ncbi:DUF928 domain-containing protein [Halotia branconii]|uniref:DUF928 domain-containing protein n=1 Tax=Halotia branconii CENA392 TaxID=1539056 RepID=A0AAJ6P8A2_9CYAN|nr:DUF928 domain-containing protein [Halotia branconii]WGV24406.1 DUF928 domain-containing protein [Halotia branconii CENA392]